MSFATIHDALANLRRGGFVLVVDDESRENEGDLIAAAQTITPAQVAFMVRHTTGIVCVSLPGERLDQLHLPLMVPENGDHFQTAFTVSVDYRHGTTTGVSASDRMATIRALADARVQASDFSRPGHIFPLRARPGGVLQRAGHTEAALDLTRLAGLTPAGVLSEVVNDDGSMARLPELRRFSSHHHIPLIRIASLIEHCNEVWRMQQAMRHPLVSPGLHLSPRELTWHLPEYAPVHQPPPVIHPVAAIQEP